MHRQKGTVMQCMGGGHLGALLVHPMTKFSSTLGRRFASAFVVLANVMRVVYNKPPHRMSQGPLFNTSNLILSHGDQAMAQCKPW